MRIEPRLVALPVIASICNLASGQLFTVSNIDPGADFQSLEVAIQTVPAGARLLVQSDISDGFLVGYYIDKDLAIVGAPGSGTGRNGFPRVMDGQFIVTNGADAHLSHMTVDPLNCDLECLIVEQNSTAQAHSMEFLGTCEHSAIEVVENAGLVMTDCVVEAYGYSDGLVNAALDMERNSLAVLTDCFLHTEVPLYVVVNNGSIYYSSTVFDGDILEGDGSLLHRMHETLELDSSTFNIGGELNLRGYAFDRLVLLFFSFTGATQPINIGGDDPLFLETPFFILPIQNPSFAWQLKVKIKDTEALIGLPVYFQQYGTESKELSCVEAGVIGR